MWEFDSLIPNQKPSGLYRMAFLFYFVIQKQRTALPDGALFYAVLQDIDAAKQEKDN